MSDDERIAVATNRSAGVVTVFALDPSAPLGARVLPNPTEIQVGANAEPWTAVLGPDDSAYVVLRHEQVVRRISHLHGAPSLDPDTVSVGSEPMSIVRSPTGSFLYVANSGDGTVTLIDRALFASTGSLDLNEALTAPHYFDDTEPRPGLAHPRALAVTDDGDEDDADEYLFATEFFSQPLALPGTDHSDLTQFDRNRRGVVYAKALGRTGPFFPIDLAPVADTGFADSNGNPTGCFPNQLYGAAIHGERLYVSALCASPVGPLGATQDTPPNTANFRTLLHPALYVVDTRHFAELPEERALFTQLLTRAFDADQADGFTEPRRMPLIPNDLAITRAPDGSALRACLTAFGADASFCMSLGGDFAIGKQGARYVDLHAGDETGKLPIGIATSASGRFALVLNDNTQNLSVLDLTDNTVAA
ncbi:MAG TPA: hypothetical protein VGQ57_02820, partial [Polyangiaceae bacterium]|nr:hypothetical protein [Polyangiaceae bacterium]